LHQYINLQLPFYFSVWLPHKTANGDSPEIC